MCLRSIVIYDHLDIYMVDKTGQGLRDYKEVKYKKANAFMKTVMNVQEFCEFRRQLGKANLHIVENNYHTFSLLLFASFADGVFYK